MAEIDQEDGVHDSLFTAVDAEIERRQTCLKNAYPFKYSDEGVLSLDATWESTPSALAYLMCLIFEHFSKEGLLHDDLTKCVPLVRSGRELFQVVATLATAGTVKGPAYSFGFPRLDHSGFQKKLATVWQAFKDGTVASQPPKADPHAKDSGIDTVGWEVRRDHVGTRLLLGQAASGANWKDKAFLPDVQRFMDQWFQERPVSKPEPWTFVPFHTDDDDAARKQYRLGLLAGRMRVPLCAAEGVHRSTNHRDVVEDLHRVPEISEWLKSVRTSLERPR